MFQTLKARRFTVHASKAEALELDRRSFLRLTGVGVAAGLLATVAAKPAAARIYFSDSPGLALSGYDSVEYHASREAVVGDAGITHEWNGATWRFASAANRDLFAANPEAYAPQYGGHCAW
ncbi:MAG: YHS domain-containing (seleno)protein, partial [Pseudomonadota bacterium]